MWTKVCHISQLPQGSATVFRSADHNIGIFHTEQGLFAMHNICPHVHTELHNGDLNHGMVYCPRHSWSFGLKDGVCTLHSRYNLATFPVKEEDQHIWVEPDQGQSV